MQGLRHKRHSLEYRAPEPCPEILLSSEAIIGNTDIQRRGLTDTLDVRIEPRLRSNNDLVPTPVASSGLWNQYARNKNTSGVAGVIYHLPLNNERPDKCVTQLGRQV